MNDCKIRFVQKQTRNYHLSQKWMWTILMVFALYESTTIVANHVALFLDSEGQNLSFLMRTLAFYLVFLSIIYRFHVADNRIVDYFYDSLPAAFAEDAERFQQYVGTLKPYILVSDGLFRVLQYILFVAAATNIDDLQLFVWIIVILMFVNAVFSAIVIYVVDSMEPGRSILIQKLIDAQLGHQHNFSNDRKVWLFNNLYFSIAIAAAMIYINGEQALLAAFILIVANTFVDLIRCEDVYEPNFRKYCS